MYPPPTYFERSEVDIIVSYNSLRVVYILVPDPKYKFTAAIIFSLFLNLSLLPFNLFYFPRAFPFVIYRPSYSRTLEFSLRNSDRREIQRIAGNNGDPAFNTRLIVAPSRFPPSIDRTNLLRRSRRIYAKSTSPHLPVLIHFLLSRREPRLLYFYLVHRTF